MDHNGGGSADAGGAVRDLLFAFGRGLIKVLIAAVAGVGVGFLVFGATAQNRADIWRSHDPPAEMFMGIGAGLLTGGVLLLVLFALPWMFRQAAAAGRAAAPPGPPKVEPWEDKRP